MKNYFLTILTVFLSLTSFTQKEATTLIKNKQYLSAWEKLENASESTENLIKKAAFARQYFSKTKMHRSFAFNNLKPGEKLGEIRYLENERDFNFVYFPIDSLLNVANKSEPENSKIDLALGDFYYDVFVIYQDDWLVKRQELMRLFSMHYANAHSKGDTTFLSAYAMGYFNLFNGNKNAAFDLLTKSYQLNPNFPSAVDQLAFLYFDEFLSDETDSNALNKSIFYSKKALAAYPNFNYKAKAELSEQIAKAYQLKNRCDSAIVYFIQSDALVPENPDVMNQLLYCFLKEERMKESKIVASNLINLDVQNIRYFQAAEEHFAEFDKKLILYEVLKESINKDIYNKERTGYLNLYLASGYLDEGKIEEGEKYLNKSIEDFKICYDPDNAIFLVLEKMKNNLGK